MSDTAADQLRRILSLIPRVADGESHAIDDVAAELGISRDLLLGDLISLTERFDEPGAFVEGVSIDWDDRAMSVRTPHFLRPMRLTMPELCALELGLSVARRERAPEERPVIDRALARLRAAITRVPANDLFDRTQHVELSAAGDAHLAEVRKAVISRSKLRIHYQGGAASVATPRTVWPYGLVFANGAWYVVGHAEESEGVRIYRLDRVREIHVLDQHFEMPADFTIEELLADGRLFQGVGAGMMSVRYSPRIARWIAEREGKVLADDGSVTVEHQVADVHWAVRHVLQYGPEAEVLSPPAMRAAVFERLKAMVV